MREEARKEETEMLGPSADDYILNKKKKKKAAHSLWK